jgi:hypothetical protein
MTQTRTDFEKRHMDGGNMHVYLRNASDSHSIPRTSLRKLCFMIKSKA